jgi:hypothetical protein
MKWGEMNKVKKNRKKWAWNDFIRYFSGPLNKKGPSVETD